MEEKNRTNIGEIFKFGGILTYINLKILAIRYFLLIFATSKRDKEIINLINNKIMEEWKIGEIFEFGGEWYQCIRGEICADCAFVKKHCNANPLFELIGGCNKYCRKDATSVIFKKLEKVGEPYIIGNKLIQRYKMYPTTYNINVHGWYHHNLDVKSWTIDIEIKQNKEDMEEKKTNFVEEIDALCKRYNMSDGVRTDFMSELKEIIKDKEKCNLKPFNLEAAKAGKPVCTRDGRKARIICFDAKGDKPIIALVEMGTDEIPNNYPIDGKDVSAKEGSYDLMMLSEKKEGWVNVYSNCLGGPYESKERALKQKMKDCIDTVKISWEE